MLRQKVTKHNISDRVKIDTNGCWNWVSSVRKNGYGQVKMNGKIELAHRVSYCLLIGVIPKNLCVLHKCDNRKCINPRHLFLGTVAENNADMIKKGRNNPPKGEYSKRSKLTEKQVKEIIEIYAKNKLTQKQLSSKFGVSLSTIYFIVNKKT